MNVYYKKAYYLLSEIAQDYLPNGIKDYIEKELKRIKNDFKNLKSDIEIEKEKEIDFLKLRYDELKNNYEELDEFIFNNKDSFNYEQEEEYDNLRDKHN